MTELVVGLDVGTSSTKAVAVTPDGTIVATRIVAHSLDQPKPGWFEQDAETIWRDESFGVLRELTADDAVAGSHLAAVAVSGMGPCLVPTDAGGEPLRPGILYGIDTRAGDEITAIESQLGSERILARGGSALSSQALGPKLLWLRRHEPDVWARTRRWFGPSSLLVHALTGEYVLDHHTASQCDPFYDIAAEAWAADWIEQICGHVEMPRLAWSTEIVGTVTHTAAAASGLPAGLPVLAGTIDAWAEAHSVGVRTDGDLMLMYGSTMFLVGVDANTRPHAGIWRTVGTSPGTSTLAAGMATSGLLTTWLAELSGRSIAELATTAEAIEPGSDGLLLLPYFAGERSPLFDAGARGVALGLTLTHTPAHWMRATYEAIAMGIRHNLEAFDASRSSDRSWRMVAVGGGAAGRLWPQVVSDVTGRSQQMPHQNIGACYGDALMAAAAAGLVPDGTDWTRIEGEIQPRIDLTDLYDRRYSVYRDLYPATRGLVGRL